MKKLIGTGVALVTPFKDDFSVDYPALEMLINNIIEGGIDFLVLLGTTAESVTLSKEEKKQIVAFCKKVNNNRLPLVLGIGGNNTMAVVEEIRNTDFDGIDAILSVSPYYNKPSQEGIYLHYKLIAEAAPIPIILYNVPGRTASNITAETTLRLARDFHNIIAIKEASGDLHQIEKIIKTCPNDFYVLSGDDGLTSKIIELGGKGAIAVIAQSHPKQFSEMVNLAMQGKFEQAEIFHNALLPIYEPLYKDGNPAGIKATLYLMNKCKNVLRPPLVPVSNATLQELKLYLGKQF